MAKHCTHTFTIDVLESWSNEASVSTDWDATKDKTIVLRTTQAPQELNTHAECARR